MRPDYVSRKGTSKGQTPQNLSILDGRVTGTIESAAHKAGVPTAEDFLSVSESGVPENRDPITTKNE